MKKVITLIMIATLTISLNSCVVKHDSTPAVNSNTATSTPSAPATSKPSTTEATSTGELMKLLNKAKSIDNCYYEIIAERNGRRQSVTKVWVNGNKAKVQSDDSMISYIDFEKGEFMDYNNKSRAASIVSPSENNINNFKLYGGAYLANADYEKAVNSFQLGDKENIENLPCAVGSYEDSASKAKIYISEQYGIVMKFDFTMGSNQSISFIKNLEIGKVTDKDVQLPQDAKLIK